MDGADCLNEENRAETDAQAMLLLARYAAMKETMWVARIYLTSEYPGPRSSKKKSVVCQNLFIGSHAWGTKNAKGLPA